MHDLIVIGDGEAGFAAAARAAAAKLKTLLLVNRIDAAQRQKVDDVLRLAEFGRDSVTNPGQEFLSIKDAVRVLKIEKNVVSFSVDVAAGRVYYGKSLILARADIPDSDFNAMMAKDANDKIKVDLRMQTSIPGVFAVGPANHLNLSDGLIALGQAATAVYYLERYLQSGKR